MRVVTPVLSWSVVRCTRPWNESDPRVGSVPFGFVDGAYEFPPHPRSSPSPRLTLCSGRQFLGIHTREVIMIFPRLPRLPMTTRVKKYVNFLRPQSDEPKFMSEMVHYRYPRTHSKVKEVDLLPQYCHRTKYRDSAPKSPPSKDISPNLRYL